jgi:hypothetical protein
MIRMSDDYNNGLVAYHSGHLETVDLNNIIYLEKPTGA